MSPCRSTWVAGVDDCGSGDFQGFSCVLVKRPAAERLDAVCKRLVKEAGIAEFHASEFNPSATAQLRAYEGCLQELATAISQSNGHAAFYLAHKQVYQAVFDAHAKKVVDSTMEKLRGGASPRFVLRKAGAMLFLVRELAEIRSLDVVDVFMDASDESPVSTRSDVQQGMEPVGMVGNHAGLLTDAADALVIFANAYKRSMGWSGLTIGRLQVVDSRCSGLVQSADIIAGFGVAHIRSQLRDPGDTGSEREREASRILQSVCLMEKGPLGGLFLGSARGGGSVLQGGPDDNVRFQLRP